MAHKHEEEFGGVRYDRHAPGCDDQLPLINRIGRGLEGHGFVVTIDDPDTIDETHLIGWDYEPETGDYTKAWTSENINGGHLTVQYNLRPYTIPQTFTMTFIYRRPGRPEWSWTSPAIPYLWDADGDGKPDTDNIIGSGVGNLWVREGVDAEWNERLVFPPGTTAADFNAPEPEATWSGNITFGYGGDIELPNLDDIAKILGWGRGDIENVLKDIEGALDGSDNVKDYIDDQDDALEKKIYIDLGFGDAPFSVTVKQYIDNAINDLRTEVTNIINEMGNKHDQTLADIINKIYGGGTVNEDGTVTWNTSGKAAVGDLNVFAGTSSPVEGTVANSLRSRSLSDNDIKAV